MGTFTLLALALLICLAAAQGKTSQKLGAKINPSFQYSSPETTWPLTSGLVNRASSVSMVVNKTSEELARKNSVNLQKPDFFKKALSVLNKAFRGKSLFRTVKKAQKMFGPLDKAAQAEYSRAVRGDVAVKAVALDPKLPSREKRPALQRQIPLAPSVEIVTPLNPFQMWLLPCGSYFNLLFRTADGSCNHHLNYGQSVTPMTRCMPAAYDDGHQDPRTLSVSGQPLPGARVVSRNVHPDKVATTDLTAFVMLWGQFADHDVILTPLPLQSPNTPIHCCGANGGPPPSSASSECFPIRFPNGDPNFDGTCKDFVRSAPVTNNFGNILLPRENQNVVTSFFDGSSVYGSDQARQNQLKHPVDSHLLRTTTDNFPPHNGLNDCVQRNSKDICFLAGDDRVNENPGLSLLHTIFMRYHNHIATQLKAISSFSSNDIIFQQARAIVGAVMQNILYSDWLPIVLGPSVRSQFNLDITPGVRTNYDYTEDPRILQSFSTAAFRFGHTLIPRSMSVAPGRRVPLRELFFTPYETRENMDTLAEGLLQAPDPEDRAQPADRHLVEELTGHLFENQEGHGKGFDLAALNIQRGRDHGLPPYNAYRQKCGLAKATTFCDPILGNGGMALSNVYDHVDDIDLFTGGLSEPAFDGGLVGETFSHLIARQFHSLKFGDRFFFTHREFPFGFTNSQVNLLRGIHLSHVLCLTTGVTSVQENPFRVSGPGNPLKPCSLLNSQHPSMQSFKDYPLL
ncbi:salivary peroxidase/catechol oxidase-like [Littorina saxatilis]|uniref:salivary peroxidase/catechol oxidase-like n=1 Tax=Littorina saxatilis TaxID=31220 RepID=UPI0038B4AFE0